MEIVLLHGMGRSRRAMRKLEGKLSENHSVHNLSYPDRATFEQAARVVYEQMQGLGISSGGDDVGMVGHSAGGVLLRALAKLQPEFRCGRCVTLGSPLQGSILASRFHSNPAFKLRYGRLFSDLTAAHVQSLPPPPGSLGSIAGKRILRYHPGTWLLKHLAPGVPSDSAVLVEETRIPEMADHVVVDVGHSFLPSNPEVIGLVERFLNTGRFS